MAQVASGVVSRLVQPRKRDVQRGVRPQRVDDSVSVQPPTRRQREELHQRGRVTLGPPPGRPGCAVDQDAKAVQQTHVDISMDVCSDIQVAPPDLIASLCWWRVSVLEESVEAQPTRAERGVEDGSLVSEGSPPGA